MKRSSTCGSGALTTRAWSTPKVLRLGTGTSRLSFCAAPIGPPSQRRVRVEASSPRSMPPTLHAWIRRPGSWAQDTASSRPAWLARNTFSTPGASSTSAVTSRPVSVWRFTSLASCAWSPSTATSSDCRIVPNTKSKRGSGALPFG